MEKNHRENELEIRNAFKKVFNKDPFADGGSNAAEINLLKLHYENELQNFKKIIEVKNAEINQFRKELGTILNELGKLKKVRA